MTTHQIPKPLAQRDGLDFSPTFALLREEWIRRKEAQGEDSGLRYLQEELEALTGYKVPRPRLSEWNAPGQRPCPLWAVGAMVQLLGGSGLQIDLDGTVTVRRLRLGSGRVS